jgi:hypothetical protein
MLNQAVFVFNPLSLGGGQYSFDLFFQNSSKAKYLAIGDRITDSASNAYDVVSATFPFVDGANLTASFVTSNVLPVEDTGFDSDASTPGQVNKRPIIQTPGALGTASIFNSTNYEYTVLASWTISAQANQSIVGDRIVDSVGREFEITFIDNISGFSVPIRVKEVEKTGDAPTAGDATLYRSTTKGYFQGSFINNTATNSIRNRDNVNVDVDISAGGSALTVKDEGSSLSASVTELNFVGSGVTATQPLSGKIQVSIPGGGGGTSFVKVMQNGSGSTIAAGVPVSKKSDGTIVPADSDAASGQVFVGITNASIANGATGDVTIIGPNIAGAITSLGFAVGSDVFIGEAGGFVDDVSGFAGDNDSVIRVGIADCSAGSASATANDIILFTEVMIRP